MLIDVIPCELDEVKVAQCVRAHSDKNQLLYMLIDK